MFSHFVASQDMLYLIVELFTALTILIKQAGKLASTLIVTIRQMQKLLEVL